MATKIAINGFGRIGRCIVRAMIERKTSDLELVAINDLTDPGTLAHLLRYDSIHREIRGAKIGHADRHITIGDKKIEVLALKSPTELPWKALGVDVVLECTGLFTDREKADGHVAAGAKKVLISAPAKGQDLTVVMGVNDHLYDPAKHKVISNGSCTTNCLAPVAKVMLDNFGIERGLMTTVHSYTNDQHLLDLPHRKGDLRRARAAAVNMIPASTGAAKALSEVIPELNGKFDGQAIRVPTVDVSIIDLTIETTKVATKQAIHAAMKAAAESGPMKGILEYVVTELVSGDYIGSPYSSSFDSTMTQVLGERFVKVFSWYDNEMGFSNRMVDLAELVAKKGLYRMKLAGIRFVDDLAKEDEGKGLANQRVFVRVDFNVPLDKKTGAITDDARIAEAIPTIRFLMEAGAKVVVASHMGRPKPGKHEGLGLEPCGARLSELTGYEVHLPDDCIGDGPKKVLHDLRAGQLCLLENLRFHEEEEKDDEAFARKLAELCDVYVDDAFGAVHRAHASVHALPLLVRRRAGGFLLKKELEALSRITDRPEKPYVAVLGGAKVSDKIDVVEALLAVCDTLCIGGAMANTFLAAQGKNMEASRVETDKLALARTILEKAQSKKVEVLLPVDVVVANALDSIAGNDVSVNAVPKGTMALDIGPKTVARFGQAITRAKTIFWNGPMGLFETPAFSHGTFDLAKIMADAKGFTVVGGGDSAAAVKHAGDGIAAKFDHISTGGGASLELIEGKKLPGVEALRTNEPGSGSGS